MSPEFRSALITIFTALRAAWQSAIADDPDNSWQPVSSGRHRRPPSDDDRSDDRGGSSSHGRKTGSSHVGRNSRKAGSKGKRGSGNSSSGSASNRQRTRTRDSDFTSVSFGPPRQATPKLADVSGKLLGISDSDYSDRPLSSVIARKRAQLVEPAPRKVNVVESRPYTVDVVEPQPRTLDVVDSQPDKTAAITSDSPNSARVAAIQRECIQMDVK